MKRLCFLSPDREHALAVIRDLKEDGISDKHIYVIARSSETLGDLPDGGPEDDDFLPAYERGLAFGGVSGLFLGLVAMTFPPAGIVIGGGGILLIGAMGASVGAFLTGMAGAAFPNSRLKAFEKDIDAGKLLIMVDVAQNQVERINQLILQHDPEVEIEGLEPSAPVVPD
tara:strand:- start:103583 stop:104092 length:510 start_codon:yes stop_codon:yes gene_type:complete